MDMHGGSKEWDQAWVLNSIAPTVWKLLEASMAPSKGQMLWANMLSRHNVDIKTSKSYRLDDLSKSLQLMVGSNTIFKAFTKMFSELENKFRGKSFCDSIVSAIALMIERMGDKGLYDICCNCRNSADSR